MVKVKSGSILPSYMSSSNISTILSDINRLRLNTVNVPVKINITNATSSSFTVDSTSKAEAIAIIQALPSDIKVILEPYPWIAGGTIAETSWNPDNINTFFWNWKTVVLNELITDIAILYNVWCVNTASNYVNMESYSEYWSGVFSYVKGLYSGLVTYRTNWWVTTIWDTGTGSTTEAYNNKLANELFGDENLDFISIACYFELNTDAVSTVTQLKQDIYFTRKYSRQQNVYQEIKNFYDTWGKEIFFGELGFSNRELCASKPYDNAPSTNISEIAQVNCFQAYKEIFRYEDWFKGFSLFCIGINKSVSNYVVVDRLAERAISSWWNDGLVGGNNPVLVPSKVPKVIM